MNYCYEFFKSCACVLFFCGLTSLFFNGQVYAQPKPTDDVSQFFSEDGLIVTKALYPRAETARQMLDTQSIAGGVIKFAHLSSLTPTDFQPVVRMNRDAYYSKAVVDVSQGATVTLPKMPEGLYLSMQPVTEDHRPQPMSYGGGTYQLATHTGKHLVKIIRQDSNLTSEQAKQYQHWRYPPIVFP